MTSGIYLWTVTREGKVPLVYIGQARNLSNRLGTYQRSFLSGKRGKSINRHLFNAVQKYGLEHTHSNVLDYCELNELDDRETYWYKYYKEKERLGGCLVANILEPKSNPMNNTEIIRKRSENTEWQHNIAEANRKKAQDPEWQHNHRVGIQKRTQDPEWRKRSTEANRRNVQTPEWKENHAVGIHQRSLNPEWRKNTIAAVVKANAKHYSGFVSPDGIVYRDIFNLCAFCREHNLNQRHMGAVNSGKEPHHKGWTKLEE